MVPVRYLCLLEPFPPLSWALFLLTYNGWRILSCCSNIHPTRPCRRYDTAEPHTPIDQPTTITESKSKGTTESERREPTLPSQMASEAQVERSKTKKASKRNEKRNTQNAPWCVFVQNAEPPLLRTLTSSYLQVAQSRYVKRNKPEKNKTRIDVYPSICCAKRKRDRNQKRNAKLGTPIPSDMSQCMQARNGEMTSKRGTGPKRNQSSKKKGKQRKRQTKEKEEMTRADRYAKREIRYQEKKTTERRNQTRIMGIMMS